MDVVPTFLASAGSRDVSGSRGQEIKITQHGFHGSSRGTLLRVVTESPNCGQANNGSVTSER